MKQRILNADKTGGYPSIPLSPRGREIILEATCVVQYEWVLSLFTSYAMVLVLLVIVTLAIYGLLLGVALRFVGGKHRELGSTFVTALLIALVSWIPCLGCILGLYFMKSRHEVGWGSALIAWILMFLIAIVVIIVILVVAFPAIWLAMWGMFWP